MGLLAFASKYSANDKGFKSRNVTLPTGNDSGFITTPKKDPAAAIARSGIS